MPMMRITMHFIVNDVNNILTLLHIISYLILSELFTEAILTKKKTLEPVHTGFPTHLQYAKKSSFFVIL